jgi:hypothetical protein
VRHLKQLEAENARLKKLVAERDLEIEVMKEVAAVDQRPFWSGKSMSIHEGMHKIAARFGVGTGTVQRIKAETAVQGELWRLARWDTSVMAIERKYERDIEPPLAPYP